MKTIFVVLVLILSISTAYTETWIGQDNQPLSFTTTNSGYYNITLHANIYLDWQSEIGVARDAKLTIKTLVNGNPVSAPTIDGVGSLTDTAIRYFPAGSNTVSVSTNLVVNSGHPSLSSATTYSYTIKSAEDIDYRNAIGELQNSIDKRGIDLTAIKDNISTLQEAVSGNNGLSDQVASLKKQVDKLSDDNKHALGELKQSVTQNGTDIAGVKADIATFQAATSDQNKGITNQVSSLKKQVDKLSDDNTQSTALILSAINGVSQQVNTVNSNVTGGNQTNKTISIIGLSLGAAGLTAGVTMPFLMKHYSEDNTDVSSSLDSDKESANYVAPGKGE